MWFPEPSDFKTIEDWNLSLNPFLGPDQFNAKIFGERWSIPGQLDAYEKYVKTRKGYISGENFQKYYKQTEKPIDKTRWEYLRKRKSWYITPLGWSSILSSSKNLKILDLGCGDGDIIQNFIEFAEKFCGSGLNDYSIQIVGADLSASRLENAKLLVSYSDKNFDVTFRKIDLSDGIPFEDKYFDAVLCTGVLEILEQDLFIKTVDEICRVTKNHIYIEDLFERFPGGYPRTDQGRFFAKNSFIESEYVLTFTEPISNLGLSDPMKIWPVMAVQNSFYTSKLNSIT